MRRKKYKKWPSGQRLTQIGVLTERGKEVLHRLFHGQRGVDIERDLGITDVHISKVKNSVVGKEYMHELENKRQEGVDEVVGRLAALEIKAVRVLEATFKAATLTKDDGTLADLRDRVEACPSTAQIRAAERLLESQGYSQPSRATVSHFHVGTSKVLANLKQRHADIEAEERKKLEEDAGVLDPGSEETKEGDK